MKPLGINPRLMPPHGIRMLMELASQIPDAIHLEVGQPSFVTPKHIIESAFRAALEGHTGYTSSAGDLSLRKLIIQKLSEQNKIKAEIENVVVTTGSACAVATSLMALVSPGDEVLVPNPGWTNYSMIVTNCGGYAKGYPLDEANDFVPNIEELKEGITKRTKAIVVNSPSNPTGAVYPPETMKSLVQLAAEYDLYLLSDEAYGDLVFEGEHVSPVVFDPDGTIGRVVSIFSFSKSYAMTGWRVGYVVANPEVSSLIIKLQEPYTSCAPSVSQKAAEAALLGAQDCIKEMVEAYKARRNMALEILKPCGLVKYTPHGAFYMMVNISKKRLEAFEFSKRLLLEKRVAAAPGSSFGSRGRDYIRIALSQKDEDIVEGAKRIRDFILSV